VTIPIQKNNNLYSNKKILFIFILILAACLVGFYHTLNPESDPTNLKTYTSKISGYSVNYPSSWSIEGFGASSNGPTTANNLTGDENTILMYSSKSSINSYGIWISNDSSYETSPAGEGSGLSPTDYAGGSIIARLSNGMNVWEESNSALLAQEPAGQNKPYAAADFEIVTNSKFGYKLKNKDIIQISMGFGYAQSQTTNYSYSAQSSSKQLKQAEIILESLTKTKKAS
jgi:hypothetical protein